MAATNRKRRSIELRSGSVLETVYETAKLTEIADDAETNQNALNESTSKEETPVASKSNADSKTADLPRTPNDCDDDDENTDVWYTPRENKMIDKTEVNWGRRREGDRLSPN